MPFDFHRFIIGQKGHEVRRMMDDFDVNISVPRAEEQSDVISVTGAPTNVENARAALVQKVEDLEKEKEDKVADGHLSFKLTSMVMCLAPDCERPL